VYAWRVEFIEQKFRNSREIRGVDAL